MSEIKNKRIIGKIIKISPKGWGFIVSKEIPFTRIFFYWTSLLQETSHFTELKKGDEVEFEVIEDSVKGFRAIKIDVLEPEKKTDSIKELENDSNQK